MFYQVRQRHLAYRVRKQVLLGIQQPRYLVSLFLSFQAVSKEALQTRLDLGLYYLQRIFRNLPAVTVSNPSLRRKAYYISPIDLRGSIYLILYANINNPINQLSLTYSLRLAIYEDQQRRKFAQNILLCFASKRNRVTLRYSQALVGCRPI